MLDKLTRLDRRWIFLAMFLAVAIPVLLQPTLPESPTPIVQDVFDAIENLPPNSVVLMSLDYDPASQPELGPMSRAMTRHCALLGHRLIFMTLWPFGGPMITQDATNIIETEFADTYVYGENYLNIGFGPGFEAAIKLIVTDLSKQFPVDARLGRPLAVFPITRGVRNLQEVDLVISVGAGYPGTKEWVQYAATPYPDIKIVGGVTGVSAPYLYPYVPGQLIGMLPAIKGAAEYEAALGKAYPRYADKQYQSALRRMGPQLSAHVLMLGLIVLGNVIFFLERRRPRTGGNR
ncbi:MAG TPA: hypothetical protein PK400_05825 [Phycisphaerales bacterium]|nr:hypothetical protein [Phycisphaerales bacterium]HRQ74905.1 hypothetical protein [Phycisphaerales bacterium]